MPDRIELEPFDIRHVAALRALRVQPGVLQWWGPLEPGFPFDEPESSRFAIVVDGAVAGLIQWGDSSCDETRHAYVDIFVGDDWAGRGIGTEAMRQMTRTLIEQHGYHRITLDPAVENEAAIRSYEKVGFRRIGVLERSYHEPYSAEWRDELLMELVADPRAD